VATLLQQFLSGNLPSLGIDPDGRQHRDGSTPKAVLAGAFNPLHAGHLGLADVASRLLQSGVAFEICICNVDKPPLSADEVTARLRQLAWRYPVWLTRTPTFVEKARLFPGAVFVVGADTAERIIAPRYYHDSSAELIEALHAIHDQGCRFLVAARRNAEGLLIRLQHLDITADFANLFQEIDPSVFELDISSTRLRQSGSNRHGTEEEKNVG
jgi:nicotinic acid mononucleotide adenylyltransferase